MNNRKLDIYYFSKALCLCVFLSCAGITSSFAQIAAPTLNSPADGYVYPNTVKPLLKINSVSGASYYMFHWSEDPTFATYSSYTMSSSNTSLNVNGLKFGTTYYWRVYAITANYADTSAASAVWSFTTTDAPIITAPNDGVVFTSTVMPTIKWTQITGASKYIYQCDTSSSFDSPMCLTYTYTGYNSSGSNAGQLHFGKTYYLRMKATNTNESDTSSWSAVHRFTTSDAPIITAPNDGVVFTSTVMPTIKWTQITGASKYIYQCDTSSSFDSPMCLTYTYTGYNSSGSNAGQLHFGKTYYLRMKATNTNESDTSSWSAVRRFTTSDAPTLTSPSDGAILSNSVRPTIKWTEITGASRYIYQCDTSSSFNSPMCLTYTYTGYNSSGVNVSRLHFGKTYYLRMKATNTDESDTSSWSAVRTFTTSDAPTLSSPNDGVVYTANVGPTVNWNTITGASHYILAWDTASTFDSPLYDTFTTTGASVNIWPIKFGTTYYWRVCATNSNDSDTSAWSTAWTFTTSDAPILTSPSDGYVYTNSVTPTLQCTAITRVGKYIYQWDTTATFNSPLCASTTKTSNSTSIGPLKLGSTYYWRMRATNYNNDSDTSKWSTVWSFTTGGSVPTLSSPSNGSTAIRLRPTLQWNSVSSCNYYDYECDTTPDFNSTELQSGSVASGTTSIRLNQLRYGTTYYWRVRIRLNSDTSSWSTVWRFTTAGTIALTSPANGSTLSHALTTTLDWDFINDGDYYEYQYDLSPGFDSPEFVSGLVAVGTSEIALTTPLRFGATYYWRVREYTSIDTTPWSATWSFTTPGEIALVSPANGSTLSRTLNPTLDWDYINGGDYYEYQYDLSPNFDSPEMVTGQRAVGTSEIDITTPLRFGATYYWRVREYTSIDTTPWSATWSFTTPGEVVLVSPANGTTNVGTSTTLDWDYIRGGTIYEYQYDVTPAFNSAELVEGSIQVGTSQVTISNLEENHLYYWRVRELSAVDTTPWSEVWHFSTRTTPIFTDIYDTVCGSYVWNNQTYTISGKYTQQFVTDLQVDSTVTLHLVVNPTYNVALTHSMCTGESYNFYGQNITVAGIYTHMLQTVNGCDSVLTLTVTVNPLPMVTITGNSTICQGSSTTLTATGANTYSWSTGDNTASATISAFGVYTVTGTSIEGCSNTANVTVLVSQLPQITITGETDICAGESTTLTANGGDTYLWSNGTTDNTLTVNLAGIYQVIGYNTAGCSSMADATVSVWQPATSEFTVECPEPCYEWNGESYCQSGDYTQTLQTIHGCDSVVTLHLTITVGVEDYNGFDLRVYPNPTTNIVNVECETWKGKLGDVIIQLYDVYGKLMDIMTVANDKTTQIDLSHYAPGVYFIKAVADGNVMGVRKVVKQ